MALDRPTFCQIYFRLIFDILPINIFYGFSLPGNLWSYSVPYSYCHFLKESAKLLFVKLKAFSKQTDVNSYLISSILL